MYFVTLNKQLDGSEVLYNRENNDFQPDCAVEQKERSVPII